MYELFKWLESNQVYFKGIELLEKYAPEHPLLDSLRSSMSNMNRIYLRAAIKEIYEAKKEPADTKKNQERIQEDAADTKTEKTKLKSSEIEQSQRFEDLPKIAQERILNNKIRKLHQNRCILSNSFHDCKSDDERAIVSDKLVQIVKDIEKAKSNYNFWKEFGMLPEVMEEKGKSNDFVMPEDDLDLYKKIKGHRSKIVNIRKRIAEYDPQRNRKPKSQVIIKKRQLEHELELMEKEYYEVRKRK